MQNRNLTKIDFYQSPMQRNDSDNSYMGDADKALESLTSKRAKLRDWIQRAWTYYNKNQIAGFVMLLENSITRGVGGYPGYKEDLLKTHMMLTGHYFRMACNDVGQRSCNWQEKVVSQLEIMDAMNMVCNEIQYLLCRGFALMLVEDCLPEADKHFVCVLRQSPYNVPALLGRGCLAYNRQEYITALGYFKTVLSHHPDGPADVRLGIAHCFLKMGALDRAGRAFELAAESNSLCINALIGAAQLKLNERKRESNIAAMELLRSALKLNDRHPVVLTWLSFHLYYTRNYENLRTAAGNAFVITDDPDLKAQNCYNIARSFHATKDYDRAFDFYGKAVKCQPNFPPAHLGVAQIYVRRGQLDLAELSLRTLLKMMPENKEALCMLGLIYTQSNESNKLNRAVLLFQRALDHGGREDCNTWLALGNVYERKQQWQQAIDAYEKAISVYQSAQSKDKDIPLPWLNNLAALQQHAGLPEAALATLDKAIRELPKNPNSEHSESNLLTLRFNRARVLEDLGRMNEAASSYMCLTVEYPNYFDSYLRLGVMAIKGNQAVVAKEHFKTITLLEVDHILARTFMGNLCARHNALSEAMCSYNVIMRRPNHAWDSNTLVAVANVCLLKAKEATKNGESDMVRKHQERALQLFAKGLQENKRNLWAANGIGVVLCHFGYLSDAETIFKMIVKSTPRCTNAILNAAHVAMGLEHYSDAVEIYGKYLKDFLPANNVTELQFLAHALYQCQQFDEAKLMLSRAMRTAPHDPNIIYNMGLVIKQAIKSSFESIQTDLTKLQEAAQEVNIALRFFQYLSQGMEPMKSARKQSKKCSKLQRKVLEELENLREQEELSKKQERRKAKKNKKRKPEKESPNEESRKINEETQTQVDEPVESPTVDNKNSKKKRSKKRRNSTRDVDEQQDLELEKSKSKENYRTKENHQEIKQTPSDGDVEKQVGPVKLTERDRILEKGQSTKQEEGKPKDRNEDKTSGETLQTHSNKSLTTDELEQKGKEESLGKKSRKAKRKEKLIDKQPEGEENKKSKTVQSPAQDEQNQLQFEMEASSLETLQKHSKHAIDKAELKKDAKEESLDKKSRKAKRKEKLTHKQADGEENENPEIKGHSQVENPLQLDAEILNVSSRETLNKHSNKATDNAELKQEGQEQSLYKKPEQKPINAKTDSKENKKPEIVQRPTQDEGNQLHLEMDTLSSKVALSEAQKLNLDALGGETLKKDKNQKEKTQNKKIESEDSKVRGPAQVKKLLQTETDLFKSMTEPKTKNLDASSGETLKKHSSKSMMKGKHQIERREESCDRRRVRKHKIADEKIETEDSRKPENVRGPAQVKKMLQPEGKHQIERREESCDRRRVRKHKIADEKIETEDSRKPENVRGPAQVKKMLQPEDKHQIERREESCDRRRVLADEKIETEDSRKPENVRGPAQVKKMLQPEGKHQIERREESCDRRRVLADEKIETEDSRKPENVRGPAQVKKMLQPEGKHQIERREESCDRRRVRKYKIADEKIETEDSRKPENVRGPAQVKKMLQPEDKHQIERREESCDRRRVLADEKIETEDSRKPENVRGPAQVKKMLQPEGKHQIERREESCDRRRVRKYKIADEKIETEDSRKPENVRGPAQVKKLQPEGKYQIERREESCDRRRVLADKKIETEDSRKPENVRGPAQVKKMLQPEGKHQIERREESCDRRRVRKHKLNEKIEIEEVKKLFQPDGDVLKKMAPKSENLDTSRREALKTHSSRSMVRNSHLKDRREKSRDREETRKQNPIDKKVESEKNARGPPHVDKKQPESELLRPMEKAKLQDEDASRGEASRKHSSKSMIKDGRQSDGRDEIQDTRHTRRANPNDKKTESEENRKPENVRGPAQKEKPQDMDILQSKAALAATLKEKSSDKDQKHTSRKRKNDDNELVAEKIRKSEGKK